MILRRFSRRLPTATLFNHTRFIDDWFSGKWYRKPRRPVQPMRQVRHLTVVR